MQPEELVRRAWEARSRAYAPYSKFQVGAAVLADGEVFTGANVENASFGLTVCAERVAILAAVAAGARSIEALAVASGPGASMCGACRQVLAEFAGETTRVYLADEAGEHRERSVRELLPEAFGRAELESGG